MKKFFLILAFFLMMFTCVACDDGSVEFDINAVVFADNSVDWNGKKQYLEVDESTLPAGIEVIYEGNGITKPGNHTVTAIFYDANGNELGRKTATLTIKSAGESGGNAGDQGGSGNTGDQGGSGNVETQGKLVTLVPGAWTSDYAWFAVYWFDGAGGEGWVKMENNQATIPANATHIIFCRMDKNKTEMSWENKWNQTEDLVLADGSTFTFQTWGTEGTSWKCQGTWA